MDMRVLLLPLALTLLGCAATQGSGPRRSARVLTADEIAEVAVTTAYEAVELTRPQWLTTRSSPTMGNPQPTPPVVYLDGIRVGDLDELRRIRATVVERMEYLSPSDATTRFGTNHNGGAILITTR
jgi:hypothetical protein